MDSQKVSLFEKSTAVQSKEDMTVLQFLKRVRDGYWKKYQDAVRSAKSEDKQKTIKKFQTPGVTMSGTFRRRAGEPDHPSGYICIDVDAADNPSVNKLRKKLEKDQFICAVWSSIRGSGFALLFKIKPAKHRELFNGIQDYLFREYEIIVDAAARDKARLRYVSYDPDCYIDLKKPSFKSQVQSLPPPVIEESAGTEKNFGDAVKLVETIEESGLDIVPHYPEWYIVGQALAKYGNNGRDLFHRISKLGDKYDKDACNTQFDNCVNQEKKGNTPKKIGLGSIFFYAKEAGLKLPQQTSPKISTKKKPRAVKGPLNPKVLLSKDGMKIDKGVYVYHIWQFKVGFRKDQSAEVQCAGLNPEATSNFLYNSGIRRGSRQFFQIVNNIVEIITQERIVDMVIQEGVKLEDHFQVRWDDDSEFVSRKSILNKIQTNGRRFIEKDIALKEFIPDAEKFLMDTADTSYLFFNNGVVEITRHGFELKTFEDYNDVGYIWRANINNKDFKYVKKKGIIHTILENAIGKKYWKEIQSALGFMTHSFTHGEGTEILFCIDRNVGELNEGGNGKDFFRQIIGNVKNTVVIPGKSLNLHHQFTWEKVDRDTQVVWIEDMGKHIKMEHLYNLNNGINVRRMHTQPFTVRPKIGVSLQHLINIEGGSDQRRQIFLMFTDYYGVRKGIGKVHGDRDIFGAAWKGWDEYHSLIVDSIRFYLQRGLIQMDINHLLELRKEEVSDGGSFEVLERGVWYSTESAVEMCWGKETIITTEVFISFKKKLAQWAKLSGLQLESERKMFNGKQQKAIRVVAPMRIIGRKTK